MISIQGQEVMGACQDIIDYAPYTVDINFVSIC